MYSMNFDITIGKYRLAALEKVAIKCSVENLADTADITLPGTLFNRALKVEQKIAEGDAVRIRLGYDRILRDEFSGYVSEIATDNDSVRIHCEDELYKFRKDLKDRVLKSVTVKTLLTSVAEEVGKYEVACDYDFTYDNFTIHAATGYDVLRKVQSETKANIYLRGKTLHVHPQYAQIGEKVIYDFAVNIEKSDLKYRDASKRKFLAVVEGTDAKGKTIRIERGTTGGDKFTLKLPGVSDRKSLEQRADEELKVRAYTGYEGSFTGWRIHCEDELYKFRKDLKDRVLKSVTVKTLLTSVAEEVGKYEVACDYDFTYDNFTIHAATGYDVLRKVQSETKANIYLRGKTLHVHPQYAQIGEKVIYDFAVNIEKSDLKYRDASKRKFLAVVEGTDAKGKTIRIERGTTGGDKFTLKLPGVSDRKSLEQRADEELKVRAYTGYEGSFTGWLEPYVEPTWLAEIRDTEYEYKNGSYYVLGVETTFCDKGASRVVTIGKRIENNG